MSDPVQLPALGESVSEGTGTRWLKNVGDTVEVDEPLLEISTDKVDTEIPSPFAGVLEQILVQEDETVEVGATLAVIGSGAGSDGSDAGAGSAEGSSDSAHAEAPAQESPTEQAPVEESAAEAAPAQESVEQHEAAAEPAESAAGPAAGAVSEGGGTSGDSGGAGGGAGENVTLPAL